MATASLLVALGLLGCPAERLGVPLPPRGEQAISQEDLQRDAWRLTYPERVEGIDSAAQHLELRLRQMGLEPGFPNGYVRQQEGGVDVCGLAPGHADERLIVLAPAQGHGVARGAGPQAVLISLAKSIHGLGTPLRSILFCYGAIDTGETEVVRLEALPLDQDSLERVDYQRLARETQRLHRAHLAPELSITP